MGESDKAHAWLARALAIDPDDFVLLHNAACVHAQLGEVDEAMEYVERAVRNVAQNTIDMLRTDRDLDPIRDHPRYALLLRSRGS